ncbi:MAG: M20/M25/M40 family metallo-hydrolase [Desulfosoma sp.]
MTPSARPAIQTARLRRLLERLVNIYSPSGKEEDAIDFLYSFLKRYDVTVIRQPVDDRRSNLLVVPPDEDIQLALIGHVDTISAYDLEDFGCEEENGELFGLGTADMKGGCAAMIEAYLSASAASSSPIPAALALVVGEEEEGDGARRLVRDYHFPWAIIGEPTDLKVSLVHYGYLEMQVVIRGQRRHASMANRSTHPAESLLHFLLRLLHYWEERWPEVIPNIRDLSSSSAGFVVPDYCEAWLDVHLPPTLPLGEIIMELEQLTESVREHNPHVIPSLRFTEIHSGYDIPDRGPFVQKIRQILETHALPWDPVPFRSHSDANTLWSAGVKPILLGPGQLEKAHSPEESVSFDQVATAARIYADILMSL